MKKYRRPLSSTQQLLVRLILSAPVIVAASCASEDPLTRPGLWHPVGANDTNLQAMVADPDDLVTGVADRRADGQLAAAAVTRYRTGHLKELPDSGISKIAPLSSNSGASSSASSGNE